MDLFLLFSLRRFPFVFPLLQVQQPQGKDRCAEDSAAGIDGYIQQTAGTAGHKILMDLVGHGIGGADDHRQIPPEFSADSQSIGNQGGQHRVFCKMGTFTDKRMPDF